MIQVIVDLPLPLSPLMMLIRPGSNGTIRGLRLVSFGQRMTLRIASLIRIGYSDAQLVAPHSSLQSSVRPALPHLGSSLLLLSRASREAFSCLEKHPADVHYRD